MENNRPMTPRKTMYLDEEQVLAGLPADETKELKALIRTREARKLESKNYNRFSETPKQFLEKLDSSSQSEQEKRLAALRSGSDERIALLAEQLAPALAKATASLNEEPEEVNYDELLKLRDFCLQEIKKELEEI